ncbi:MAG: hypothetical protein AABZ58_07620, partial [Chloroflexota bacterium]
ACIKHAASVHPEPGSNSSSDFLSGFHLIKVLGILLSANADNAGPKLCISYHYSVVKVLASERADYTTRPSACQGLETQNADAITSHRRGMQTDQTSLKIPVSASL